MTLVTFEPRAAGSLVEPFSLMRNLLRWDPAREPFFNVGLPDARLFAPAFDVREVPEGYRFTADLPGVKQEDLEINLTGNRLTLSGKRELESPADNQTAFIQERCAGAFCRTFNLPEGIDGNGVRAELRDGVLSLLVPKVPEVQPRRIEVKVG